MRQLGIVSLIILLALVVGGGFYVYGNSETPDPPAISEASSLEVPLGWSRYADGDLDIEFAYPQGWSVEVTRYEDEKSGNYARIKLKNVEDFEKAVRFLVDASQETYLGIDGKVSGITSFGPIDIFIFEDPEKYMEGQTIEEFVAGLPVGDRQQVAFNGYSAWSFRYGGVAIPTEQTYLFESKGKLYSVRHHDDGAYYDDERNEMIRTIISTVHIASSL